MRIHPTLRDHFAMAALTGLLADPDTTGEAGSSFDTLAAEFAAASYVYADAMVKARAAILKAQS